MSELDKGEYQRIEAAIRATEDQMANNPHVRHDASIALMEPARKRLETMDQEGRGLLNSSEERKKQSMEAAQIAVLVLQESRLNSAEKQTYGGFLQSEYFTRSDFEKLEDFYAEAGPWDRLSPEGKKQMSDRFWGGLEQGEYTLDEAPDNVRKKEIGQLFHYLEHPDQAPESIKRMSPSVKEELLEAHRSGDAKAAEEILNSKDLFESSTKVKTQAASERSELADSEESSKALEEKKDSNIQEESEAVPEESYVSFEELPSAKPTELKPLDSSTEISPN